LACFSNAIWWLFDVSVHAGCTWLTIEPSQTCAPRDFLGRECEAVEGRCRSGKARAQAMMSDNPDNSGAIELEIFIALPREEVFRYLVEPALMAR
jgi:hypothetical protein